MAKRRKPRTQPDDPKVVARTFGAVDEIVRRANAGQGMVVPALGVATIVAHIAMLTAQNQYLAELVRQYESIEDEPSDAPVTAGDDAQDEQAFENEGS